MLLKFRLYKSYIIPSMIKIKTPLLSSQYSLLTFNLLMKEALACLESKLDHTNIEVILQHLMFSEQAAL